MPLTVAELQDEIKRLCYATLILAIALIILAAHIYTAPAASKSGFDAYLINPAVNLYPDGIDTRDFTYNDLTMAV